MIYINITDCIFDEANFSLIYKTDDERFFSDCRKEGVIVRGFRYDVAFVSAGDSHINGTNRNMFLAESIGPYKHKPISSSGQVCLLIMIR